MAPFPPRLLSPVMPPKKGRTVRKKVTRKKPPQSRQGLRVVLAGVFLAAFLILCLTLLWQMRPSYRSAGISSTSVEELREDVRVEVESLLLRAGKAPEAITERQEGEAWVLAVQGDFPADHLLEFLESRLRRRSPDLRLERSPQNEELHIFCGNALLYRLQFGPTTAISPSISPPRMAIIMDDLGRDTETARRLLAIDLPVTLSILPGTPNAARVAVLGHREGREILIHLPMEPHEYPAVDPGADALLVAQSPEEIRHRVLGYLERVPYAVGGNNHMGSRFTENRSVMAPVLDVLKEEGLFFVDSRTSGRSVAYAMAREAGLPTAARDVFLDNVQQVAAVRAEIRKLATLAGKQGKAVGICHPYPETLEALRLEAPSLREAGISMVPVSALLIRK